MWDEVADQASGPTHRWAKFVAPVGAAILLAALGRVTFAAVVLVLGLIVVTVTTISPAAERLVARGLTAVSRAVGTALTFLLLGLTTLFVLLPVSLVQRLLPDHGPWASDAGSWRERADGAELVRRGFGVDPALPYRVGGPVRRVARVVPLVAGALAAAMVVDFALGATIDHLTDTHDEPVAADAAAAAPDQPALADAAWATNYYDALGRLTYDHAPYLYPRLQDTETPYINSANGVRRSYEPPTAADLPAVWLFGGSALWGEGQRDRHTIPSELARLAERDGLPVRAVNLGAPGYGSWQEAMLFERALAHDDPPAVAAFYHGANDLAMQLQYAIDDPTTFEYPAIHEVVTGAPIGTAAPPPVTNSTPGGSFGPVWDRYVQASLVAKALRQVRSSVTAQDAGAAPASTGIDPLTATVDVYRRSRTLAEGVGRRHDVPTRFFWQPVEHPSDAYRAASAAVAPETVDLTTSLAATSDPVWIDAVHTNEQGARLVAATLWDELRPDIEAWYDDHGGPP